MKRVKVQTESLLFKTQMFDEFNKQTLGKNHNYCLYFIALCHKTRNACIVIQRVPQTKRVMSPGSASYQIVTKQS